MLYYVTIPDDAIIINCIKNLLVDKLIISQICDNVTVQEYSNILYNKCIIT